MGLQKPKKQSHYEGFATPKLVSFAEQISSNFGLFSMLCKKRWGEEGTWAGRVGQFVYRALYLLSFQNLQTHSV